MMEMGPRIVSVPAEFPGTAEEKRANRLSHHIDPMFQRCVECDCRPWGRVAEWPCGAEVPRVYMEDAF